MEGYFFLEIEGQEIRISDDHNPCDYCSIECSTEHEIITVGGLLPPAKVTTHHHCDRFEPIKREEFNKWKKAAEGRQEMLADWARILGYNGERSLLVAKMQNVTAVTPLEQDFYDYLDKIQETCEQEGYGHCDSTEKIVALVKEFKKKTRCGGLTDSADQSLDKADAVDARKLVTDLLRMPYPSICRISNEMALEDTTRDEDGNDIEWMKKFLKSAKKQKRLRELHGKIQAKERELLEDEATDQSIVNQSEEDALEEMEA